ncbi:hypothetical protein I7I51_00823 [Histoplasma capsulatum]|uniref:Uncharacterized protein n=1 Tax=Ajellomyces capsulatus TaxID=5037 RepID=A0A8A1MGH1_AJECA|nr:hypothetical protein I7I51_00823 [Histoplasma capsulatum]
MGYMSMHDSKTGKRKAGNITRTRQEEEREKQDNPKRTREVHPLDRIEEDQLRLRETAGLGRPLAQGGCWLRETAGLGGSDAKFWCTQLRRIIISIETSQGYLSLSRMEAIRTTNSLVSEARAGTPVFIVEGKRSKM